ncbi:MAG: hypothetical protein A2X08_05135 [Bacteroidetes bacterium GWA2_32_17]|nr:MAG: hypothetical protein A2X08_05135 [Bacteroidetes bacterium GWA2_32_17]
MLVLKTVIYISKLLDFQNFASLVIELYISDSWTPDILVQTRLYRQTLNNNKEVESKEIVNH